MYQIGDYIVYANSGVCKVQAVGRLEIEGIPKEKNYYTLCPIYGMETIYAPVETKAYMRPVLSQSEAERLIGQIPAIQEGTLESGNLQMQELSYRKYFQEHDCRDLIRLIKAIRHRSACAKESGKKLGKMDEKYQKLSEDLLYGELAVSLHIPREDVEEYIMQRCQEAG